MEKKSLTPFQLILLLVALIVVGGALGYGFTRKKAFDQNVANHSAQARRFAQMESMGGYPNQETVDKVQSALVAYKGKIEGVRSALKPATIDKFPSVSPGAFTTKLEKSQEKIKALYQQKEIALPENWYLGFEKYNTVLAPKGATGELSYQLDAVQWLHLQLAKHNPTALINLHRKPLASESKSAPQAKPKRGSRAAKAPDVASYTCLPLELTFQGQESDIRAFLNEITSSSEYLYTIDTLKLSIIHPEPVAEEEDAIQEEEASTSAIDDAFASFFDGEADGEKSDDESPQEATEVTFEQGSDEDRLFEQVLGSEEVSCFIDLNLIYLPADLDLPEIKTN